MLGTAVGEGELRGEKSMEVVRGGIQQLLEDGFPPSLVCLGAYSSLPLSPTSGCL